MSAEFPEWPKIARLNRQVVVTEKIDGTNSLIQITHLEGANNAPSPALLNGVTTEVEDRIYVPSPEKDETWFEVRAGSRTRWIHPGQDNFAFAKWVWANAEALVRILGEGRHYGEWWGAGIQRGYGLPKGEKRFSLFNVKRWSPLTDNGLVTDWIPVPELSEIPELGVVPVLWWGNFNSAMIELVVEHLRANGSRVVPGFKNPEGVVVYHTAANQMFKITLLKDEVPKALADKGVTNV